MSPGWEDNLPKEVEMALAKIVVTAGVIIAVISLTQITPVSGDEKETDQAVIGSYEINQRDLGVGVYLANVFEKDGKLKIFLETGDVDFPLEPAGKKKHEYKIPTKSMGDLPVKFTVDESGIARELHLMGGTPGLDFTATRVDDPVLKLRDFHTGMGDGYVYRKPLEIPGDWETGTLEEAGIDTAGMNAFMRKVLEEHPYMESILIVRNGKLIFEEYLNGWDPARIHRLQSVTKGFTSTLVGIAIDQGFVGSLDDPIRDYLPDYSEFFGGKKDSVTVRHLLTMSAGFKWNETETYYADPKKCDPHLAEASEDYFRYLLERPIVEEPGTVYRYNSGYPNILGHIIEERSGMKIVEFAYRNVFEPLGIKRAFWMFIRGENKPSCAGGLKLMSRDLARYGYLYLKEGVWEGKRVVPAEWVKESLRDHFVTDGNVGRGFWWGKVKSLDGEHDILFASGTGGQYVVVIPDLDTVVVTTAVFRTDRGDAVAMLLLESLFPALK
jgi:CubicO group peptidase (beta-lactamase class C family)